MKLGIITAFPPSKVTLNEYAYHLTKNFVKNESIEELILFTDKTKLEKTLDFPFSEKITIIECWNFNSYNNLFSISNAIKYNKPDQLLFNFQFMKFGDKKVPAALGLLLPIYLRFFGFKTTVLLHNILETVDLNEAGFVKNKLSVFVYNCIGNILTRIILSANIVAVTIPKYKRILENKYNATNVVVIPHGTFEIPNIPSYNIPSGAKKIMAFGKFGTYKKVEILIEAVKRVRERTGEALEIVVAGTNNPNTPNYLQTVKRKYKNLKMLTFTGYVEEEKIAKLFNDSSVVVFPYTSTTGSSGVLHQAGSYGKAVVLPNIGDLKELIKEEAYNGEFFNVNDIESLAVAIQKIVVNDLYRIELGKINYEAATTFPMSKICNLYINAFKTAV
jgi:glycosyltransferase involved in cell wall biosynthesis